MRVDEDAIAVAAAELVAGAETASLDIWLTGELDDVDMLVAVVEEEAAGWTALLDEETGSAGAELDDGLALVWKVV